MTSGAPLGFPGSDPAARDAARARFALSPSERVLDVGCGALPFAAATHLCDVSRSDDSQRLLGPLPRLALPFFEASAECLPLGDKSFDFVHCTHVLEHLRDPAAACRELSRVGRRGYVECPASWIERVFHSPDHRWLVDHEQGRLVFRELLDDERRDLLGLQYEILSWLEQRDFQAYWQRSDVRAARLVQYYWEGRIECLVVPRAQRRAAGAARWFHAVVPPAPNAPERPTRLLDETRRRAGGSRP